MPKKTKVIFAAVIFAAAYFAIYFYLLKANFIRIKELFSERAKIREIYLINKGIRDNFEKNSVLLEDFNSKNKEIFFSILDTNEFSTVIANIKNVANKNNVFQNKISLVNIEERKVGELKNIGGFYCYELLVEAEGNLNDIMNFIYSLQNNRYKYFVTNLKLFSDSNLIEEKISVDCNLCVYTVKMNSDEEIFVEIESNKNFENPFYYGKEASDAKNLEPTFEK